MGNIHITDIDVVRAWKDEEYRSNLTEAQLAQLPENPAGLTDIMDEEMNDVIGGWRFPGVTKFLRCGRVLTVTAECGCGWTLTGRCRCRI
ncbi:mersacidin/lichenicidin family type 2 lantibiotic [Halotia wernerae UHCC 0503]|nr:mersacidin/lichenicidin family type 2 lantibiotic [Halotia wernerae UHCC 0503]